MGAEVSTERFMRMKLAADDNTRRLTGQVMRTEATTGTRTIRCVPDISDAAWHNASLESISIPRTPDELLAYIKELG